ncbi:hypothetical protein FO440_21195 [Mucilaginibacter corticis]|uniref:Uncharacterized protein n=1 Tax=Mucilaginibacter corticis TaxID=2597670 RepID=A0A556MBP2_9SPHI|nr:hypothetical protein [Mucilaginibacter corticis]TSJ37282.1 hypothetical protein FO440_21195 [Mucilaginibacter corticis]
MRKYLQISYYTLTGIKKRIDLGDITYGEWIIYDVQTPRYHVCVFEKDNSNTLIYSLLNKKQETMDSIIKKINRQQGTKLSFGKRPLIEIIKKEESINLNLTPLPEHWVQNIL